MKSIRALMLLGLCIAAPVQAGLFNDDEARENIQRVEARVLKLEEQNHLQTQSIVDLQGQIETVNGQVRDLRGQNEELTHELQDAEKREKDFYVDLDGRLRRVESPAQVAASGIASVPVTGDATPVDADDPAIQNRAIEAGYTQLKAGKYTEAVKSLQEFIRKYPDSVYVVNAAKWLGDAQYAQRDYTNAISTYRALLKNWPDTPKTPDVLLNIAFCQKELKAAGQARSTLRLLIFQYPNSSAGTQAKKLDATFK
jgi:tol-pal system protein YbgF